jgi:hypothetical protein
VQYTQFKKERRRFLAEPRAQILAQASALLGTTELVCYGGKKYDDMIRFGWEMLDRDGLHALMKAPAGWCREEIAA